MIQREYKKIHSQESITSYYLPAFSCLLLPVKTTRWAMQLMVIVSNHSTVLSRPVSHHGLVAYIWCSSGGKRWRIRYWHTWSSKENIGIYSLYHNIDLSQKEELRVGTIVKHKIPSQGRGNLNLCQNFSLTQEGRTTYKEEQQSWWKELSYEE